MYDKKRNHKKIKKRRSFRAVFLTALICAAVSVLVIVGALWFVGLRYVSLNTADGTKIKFFGMVDSDGTPMRQAKPPHTPVPGLTYSCTVPTWYTP